MFDEIDIFINKIETLLEMKKFLWNWATHMMLKLNKRFQAIITITLLKKYLGKYCGDKENLMRLLVKDNQ